MKILFSIFAFSFFCCSCASITSLQTLKEDDFSWEEKTVTAGYQEVYRRLIKGFRNCDSENIYVSEANLYTDIREAEFIIYSNVGPHGGKTRGPFVIGKILLKSVDDSNTKVSAAVVHFWVKSRNVNLKRTTDWIKMADGDYSWCQ